MDIEKVVEQQNDSMDSSYGGCRYRLRYDRYEGKQKRLPTIFSFRLRPFGIFITVSVVVIFLVLVTLTVFYFKAAVSRFFRTESASNMHEASAFRTTCESLPDIFE